MCARPTGGSHARTSGNLAQRTTGQSEGRAYENGKREKPARPRTVQGPEHPEGCPALPCLPFKRIADQRLHGYPPLRRNRRTTGPNHRAIGSYRRPTNHIATMTTTISTPTARMYSSPPIPTHPLSGGATTSAIQFPIKL